VLPKKLKFLASIKLAVFILLSLGIISAVGTFYESLYNASYAKLVVYQSFWMVVTQILLAINLSAVMVDRLPWKIRHLPFLLAHIGIILVLIGSVFTYYYGVDGVMVFPLGGKNRFVQVNEKEFSVYSSFDGNKFTTLFNEDVDFFGNNPNKNETVYNVAADAKVEVLDYYIFAESKSQVLDSENKEDGPAVRFFIEGSRAKETGWLVANKIFKEVEQTMGLAKVKLGMTAPSKNYKGVNEIYFYPVAEEKLVGFTLFNKTGSKKGTLKIGEVIETGWMDFKLRVLSYKPHAYRGTYFDKLDFPHAMSTEAVKVKFMDKEYWLGLNQPLKVFLKDRVYVLNYGQKRVDIGFNMLLKNFKVGRYQGTLKAASYESLVGVGDDEVLISMNEPYKRNGLTFYQSSFQEDEMGNPTHSILSVNKDPGRWIKYLGCLLICLGAAFLFYFKRRGGKWKFVK
jgi:hypothetical protein